MLKVGKMLGYNAPIEVYDRIYYHYAESDYSICDMSLNEDDSNLIKKAVDLLDRDGKRDEMREVFLRVRNRLESLLN